MHSSVATSQENELYPQGRPRGRVEDLPTRSENMDNDSADDPHTSQKNVCEFCKCTFKNERGVRIHQGRMKCQARQEERRQMQISRRKIGQEENHRICEANPPETEEPSSPNTVMGSQLTDISTQRSEGLSKVTTTLEEVLQQCRRSKKTKCICIKFPSSTSKEWKALDEDLEKILEGVLKGECKKKIENVRNHL